MKATMTFVEGPILPNLIADEIQGFNKMKQIGAHSIFIGQVRNDQIDGNEVLAINYTAYQEMAQEKAFQIMVDSGKALQLEAAKIIHSLGEVNAGEICLFVIAVSKHRKAAMEGCEQIVERLKQELPIWGKEIFPNNSHQWKVNK
jgi:molybdopterin synthase catalytic subunit